MDPRIEEKTEKFTLLDALRLPKKPRLDEQMKMLTYGLYAFERDAAAISSALGKDLSTDLFGHNAAAIGLNAMEATSNLVTALSLMSDEVYHPQKTAMIALNFISGINLLTLTDSFHTGPFFGISQMGMGTTLAAPAFAFSMLCDFTAAAIDLYYSTEQGYLERMLGEAEFYNQQLKKMEEMYFEGKAPKLRIDEDEIFKDTLYDYGNINDEDYQIHMQAYEILLNKQESLLFDLECQLQYYGEFDEETPQLAIKPLMVSSGKQRTATILRDTTRYSHYLLLKQHNIHDLYKIRHEAIEASRQKLHYHNKLKLGVKAASFGGMLLQAMPTIWLLAGSTLAIPYINLISLCLITLVALVYFYQLQCIHQPAAPADAEAGALLPADLSISSPQAESQSTVPTVDKTASPTFEVGADGSTISHKFFFGDSPQDGKRTPSPTTPTRPTGQTSPLQPDDLKFWKEKKRKVRKVPTTVDEGNEAAISRSSSQTDMTTRRLTPTKTESQESL